MIDLLRNHIDYNIWATSRLLAAASQLSPDELQRDFGASDKSIQGTLTHIFRAERIWLARIHEGTPNIPWGLPADEHWDTLLAEWPALQQKWRDWARRLSPEDADRILSYSDMKGNPQSEPLWQVTLHVVNHSTHHRGQASGFLRASGRTPPPLDFIAYMRQLKVRQD